MIDLLKLSAKVECAVKGHNWGEPKGEGYPYLSHYVCVCIRCGDRLKEKAPPYTEAEEIKSDYE